METLSALHCWWFDYRQAHVSISAPQPRQGCHHVSCSLLHGRDHRPSVTLGCTTHTQSPNVHRHHSGRGSRQHQQPLGATSRIHIGNACSSGVESFHRQSCDSLSDCQVSHAIVFSLTSRSGKLATHSPIVHCYCQASFCLQQSSDSFFFWVVNYLHLYQGSVF